MSEDLEAFKDELRAAGQPWSRRGVTVVGVGVVGLLISQVAPTTLVIYLALASLAVIMVGWVFLVLAFVKRRRWAKARPLHMPSLADPGSL